MPSVISIACSSPGPEPWFRTAVRLLRLAPARGVGSSRTAIDNGIPIPLPLIPRDR